MALSYVFFLDCYQDAAAAAKAKAKAAAAPAKKKKKKIEKTQLTFFVNPAEVPCDMDKMEEEIRAITIEGLVWGVEFGREDVAFGMVKMQPQCVIINDLVDTDAVYEAVQAIDLVGSVQPGTMNRL